jgi:hypothetical protein
MTKNVPFMSFDTQAIHLMQRTNKVTKMQRQSMRMVAAN